MFRAVFGPFRQKLVPKMDPVFGPKITLSQPEMGPKKGPKKGQKTIMAQNPRFWPLLGEARKWPLFWSIFGPLFGPPFWALWAQIPALVTRVWPGIGQERAPKWPKKGPKKGPKMAHFGVPEPLKYPLFEHFLGPFLGFSRGTRVKCTFAFSH